MKTTSAAFPADWWECRKTLTGGRLCAWLCKPASSTSAREKATSNICTAQVLLAVIAGFYGTYHGPDGLRRIASRVHSLTISLAEKLRSGGVEVETEAFFDTISVRVPGEAEAVAEKARQRRINLRVTDADTIGISLDETTTPEIVADVLAAFGIESGVAEESENTTLPASSPIPQQLRRTSPFMEHPCVPQLPLRSVAHPLHPPSSRPRHRLGQSHDPPRLLHDEAERRH